MDDPRRSIAGTSRLALREFIVTDVEDIFALNADPRVMHYINDGIPATREDAEAAIIGVTHPDNAASQRVLLKAGLRDEGWGDYYNQRLRLFAISRAQATST